MRPLALVALLTFCFAAHAATLARWVQLGPGGAADERAIIEGSKCPAASDGAPMTVRAPADSSFALICAAAARETTSLARARDPQHMVVLGDTGCRIKPPALQDCSDLSKWPFPLVAASAAKLKPDLVIHVGDRKSVV